MESPAQTLGVIGEELAFHFLAARGYKILLRNYECAIGEIDLIAKQAGALVFVEVKTRSTCKLGSPAESVTPAKRQQIIKTASYYLKRYGIKDVPCRFDVVAVLIPFGAEAEIELIADAFGEGS